MKREPTIYRSPRDKFLRDAAREAERQAEHRVKVRFDGRYRPVCSCSWAGDAFDSRAAAEQAAAGHAGGAA